MNRDQDKTNPRIPENDPSKAMDSKKDVERSRDERTDEDFPGYPHYPAKDDILNRNDTGRVNMDVENLPSGRNATGVSQRFINGQDRDRSNAQNGPQDDQSGEDLGLRMGNEADVDDDDLVALNATDAEIGTPQNVSNEDIDTDLDVPGSELDDQLDEVGEEDEENNYYSLGGDRHEAQEEDPYSGPVREGE